MIINDTTKKILFITIWVAVVLGIAAFLISKKNYFIINKTTTKTEEIHYHAGFVVFENNKKISFSDNKYMFIKPCTIDGKEIENEGDEQIEKAHLHDNVGDLVHIEEKGAIWNDLFTNINFPINYSQTTAYINGVPISNFESQSIQADDSLVLFIGTVDKSLLSQAVTKEYIETQAVKSGTCSD